MLKIFRSGEFQIKNPIEDHKCGILGKNFYKYEVEITCGGQLRPPQYFIIDNNDIHKYFYDTYVGSGEVHCVSCELMAMRATKYFEDWFNKPNHKYQKVEKIVVRIYGTEHTYLESTWNQEKK